MDTIGETAESEEARMSDWELFNRNRLTIGEAMVLDTNRQRKLCALIQRRRQRALQAEGCH